MPASESREAEREWKQSGRKMSELPYARAGSALLWVVEPKMGAPYAPYLIQLVAILLSVDSACCKI